MTHNRKPSPTLTRPEFPDPDPDLVHQEILSYWADHNNIDKDHWLCGKEVTRLCPEAAKHTHIRLHGHDTPQHNSIEQRCYDYDDDAECDDDHDWHGFEHEPDTHRVDAYAEWLRAQRCHPVYVTVEFIDVLP